MNNTRWLLPATALIFAACATAPPPPPPAQASGLGPRATEVVVAEESLPVTSLHPKIETGPTIPIPDHHSIRAALNLFTTEMRDEIQTSLIRCGRYKKTIDAALADYRLPKVLAYLPVIESAYIPTLTSRAGAHGIWQFM